MYTYIVDIVAIFFKLTVHRHRNRTTNLSEIPLDLTNPDENQKQKKAKNTYLNQTTNNEKDPDLINFSMQSVLAQNTYTWVTVIAQVFFKFGQI